MKKKIVFQGDSITHGKIRIQETENRTSWYVKMIEDENIFNEVLNKGISGNGILNMFERWQRDTINESPDVLSIYIGVNDVLHAIRDKDGVDEIMFYDIYDTIIRNTKRLLPNTEIILMSPFVYDNGPEVEHCYDEFKEKLKEIINVVSELAKKYNFKYVPLQEIFDKQLEIYQKEQLVYDGIHPTELGHRIIKDAFLSVYSK